MKNLKFRSDRVFLLVFQRVLQQLLVLAASLLHATLPGPLHSTRREALPCSSKLASLIYPLTLKPPGWHLTLPSMRGGPGRDTAVPPVCADNAGPPFPLHLASRIMTLAPSCIRLETIPTFITCLETAVIQIDTQSSKTVICSSM